MPTAKTKSAVKAPVKKVAAKKPTVKKQTALVKKAVIKELPKQTGLKLNVYTATGGGTETITLPKEIFDAKVNNPLMAQAIRVYLANQRRGTVKTKSRGEVKISTRKIYRQKGTGRARHGAASAPIFVGGGIAFGPRQRDYSLKLNQKARRLALFSALSVKLKSGEIKIVKGLEKLELKTKTMSDSLKNLSLANGASVLIITPKAGKEYENVVKSARNIKGVSITPANLLNTYEVLKNKEILFMRDSIESLKENFLK